MNETRIISSQNEEESQQKIRIRCIDKLSIEPEKIFEVDNASIGKNPSFSRKYYLTSKMDPDEDLIKIMEGSFPSPDPLPVYYELAALGGDLWRYIAGPTQPKCYFGQTDSLQDQEYFRVSTHVDILEDMENFVDFKQGSNSRLLKNLFEFNKAPSLEGKPAIGIIFYLTILKFFENNDIKNYGLKDEGTIYRAIGFDTEFYFNYLFWNEPLTDNIFKDLQFISDYSEQVMEGNVDSLSFWEQIQEASTSAFWLNYTEEYADKEPFNDIYLSIWKRFEVYAALSRLFSIPKETYTDIIKKHTQHQSSSKLFSRLPIIEKFMARLEAFKEAAKKLPEFNEFYQAYTDPDSQICRFWQSFLEGRSLDYSISQDSNNTNFPSSSRSENHSSYTKISKIKKEYRYSPYPQTTNETAPESDEKDAPQKFDLLDSLRGKTTTNMPKLEEILPKNQETPTVSPSN